MAAKYKTDADQQGRRRCRPGVLPRGRRLDHGGVGTVTAVSILMRNTLTAALLQKQRYESRFASA